MEQRTKEVQRMEGRASESRATLEEERRVVAKQRTALENERALTETEIKEVSKAIWYSRYKNNWIESSQRW